MRDFAPLFDASGNCRVCGQPRQVLDAHGEMHLSRGEALVVVDWPADRYRERVIPMPEGTPEESGIASFSIVTVPRKLDKKLAALVQAHIRKGASR